MFQWTVMIPWDVEMQPTEFYPMLNHSVIRQFFNLVISHER